MDADEDFEKLALVRTDPDYSREGVLTKFRDVARVTFDGRYANRCHSLAAARVQKKDYLLTNTLNKRRFGTAKARDDWIKRINTHRVHLQTNYDAVGVQQRIEWSQAIQTLSMAYLAKYGAIRASTIDVQNRIHGGEAILKPIPCIETDNGVPILAGISVSPISNDTGLRAITPSDGLQNAVVPIVCPTSASYHEIFTPECSDAYEIILQRMWRENMTNMSETTWRCTVSFADMASRLYIKHNLCLLARQRNEVAQDDEKLKVPEDVWRLIAEYARSPPYLVMLDMDDSIAVPEREAREDMYSMEDALWV